ncbi:hypothetical protein LOTGIDRAFT_166536 [Lottia gigantea]|uniref:U3 small nucleolar RNA-associated protein 6 homolog C-terminal domain-containing protein n=1 Tax=Lottia gigantea TaxID=225164 RepID=V4BEX6_LOTGI|nr:hypothetical protein LOTGIDRAFT_166536 [Lottia gigantea]ESO87389.1 hypothetical protein LOTGIDRAFT_166536 [Lottia gigantea]
MSHSCYCNIIFDSCHGEMWGLYIKQCIELMKEKTGTGIKQKRIEKVLNVFNDGSKRQLLTEELYIQWIDILVNVGLLKKAEETGCESVKNYCTSVKLWKKRLLLAVQTGKLEDDILKLFNSAKKVVNEKT